MKTVNSIFIFLILSALFSCDQHDWTYYDQLDDYNECMKSETSGIDINTMTLEEKQDSSAICREETNYPGMCFFAYENC